MASFTKNRKYSFLVGILVVAAFVIGWLMPSPIGRYHKTLRNVESVVLVDTTNMLLPNGSRYDGSIVKGTLRKQGYGRLSTAGGSVYEGNWKNDRLTYGQRTTASSIYKGRFDKDLNNEGFGIVEYLAPYIDLKRRQNVSESDIVVKYIGNWHNNTKHGLGRSIMADGSMDFGIYANGVLSNKENRPNFKICDKIYGIDISHYQRDIDWDNLALYCNNQGGISLKSSAKDCLQPIFFVYIKATEGATIQDETYSIRAIEAERHGLYKGAYHFLHLGSSVEDQVLNFIETAKWTDGDLPPALDIEIESEIKTFGEKKLVETALSWLEEVENKMHVQPIIYTRESIYNKYLQDARFKKYDFWIAKYSDNTPQVDGWRLWQMSERGRAHGYDGGSIDVNIFNGDYAAFLKYIGTIL